MTLIVEPENADHRDSEQPAGGFDLRTDACDASRARLQIAGHLDAGAAVLLGEVLDGHLRAGRRYLRIHIGALQSISSEAIAVIADVHQRLLGVGGTMILTGVDPETEAALRASTPTSPLLLLAPTAAETFAVPESRRS
jgi:anti-anti-sigma factor